MNQNNNNDLYRDDNSFNSQGMDIPQDQPTTGESLGNMANSGMNFAKGINNMKNNPALGLKKPKEKGKESDKKDSNNKNNQNNDDPTKGQKKDNNNNNNQMPGAKRNQDNKKPNNQNDTNNKKKSGDNNIANKNKQGGMFSRFNPMNKTSKGKTGGTKKAAGVEAPNLNQMAKKGLRAVWTAAPIQVKLIIIGIAIIPIVILAFISFFAIFGATVAATTAAMCGQTEYDVGNADATAFLCSMSSPFGDNDFVVSGTSGWRFHPNDKIWKFHYGIDAYPSTSDWSIHAVQTGTIEEIGYNGGWGNTVLINHGNFYTRYAHLASFESKLKKGVQVEQGAILGIMGSTGNSTGPHLHFEFRDADGKYLSSNPFFGYSDQGYEQCIDDTAKNTSSYCTFDSNKNARKIGEDGFNQICGRTSNYSNGGNNSDCCGVDQQTNADLVDFVGAFEGNGGYCDPAKTLYKAYKNKGDRVTIGYGVTDDYIPGLKIGDCRSVEEVDAAKMRALDSKRSFIQRTFKDVDLTTYEEDAMTSMAYNGCGDFFVDIAKAAKEGSYEGVWKAMKGCTNPGSEFQLGLERRRKAEFALYVTGDYSIASEYKLKSWTAAEYNDYDSENIMARKATGTSSECVVGGGDKSKVVEIAIRELEANKNASTTTKCSNIEKYLKACNYNNGNGGTHHYCGGFVTYVLKEAGVDQYVGLPSNACYIPNYKNGITVGTFYKARGSYVPEPGDIAISNDWGHVMIVEKVEGETLHVIGGNQSPFNNSCPNNGAGSSLGNVTRNTYSLNSSSLTGYITYNVPSSYSSAGSAENMKKYTSYKTLKTFKIGDLTKKATIKSKYGANIAQSFAIADNYYIVAQMNRAETVTAIQAYKTSDGKLVNSLKGYFGHSNGMAYNEKTGKIIVTHRSGYKKYWKFSATNAISGSKLNSSKHTFNSNISSIAYDKTNNKYYTGTGKIRIYDSNFNKIKQFSKIRSRTSQDVGAYNGIVLVVDDDTYAPKKNALDLYRASDGAYLGSYNFNMPNYELESVAWDYNNNELALLFYKTPGYNYIYTTKATILN